MDKKEISLEELISYRQYVKTFKDMNTEFSNLVLELIDNVDKFTPEEIEEIKRDREAFKAKMKAYELSNEVLGNIFSTVLEKLITESEGK